MNYTLTFKSLVTAALFAALIPQVSLAQTVSVLTATTLPATSITEESAQLNGFGSNPSKQITIWFEWGETQALGEQTYSRMYWGEHNGKIYLTDLKKNTRYYYRVAVISKEETRYGETLSFITKGAPIATASTGSAVGASNSANASQATSGSTTKTADTTKSGTTASTGKTTTAAASKTTTTKTTTSADEDCATTTASTIGGATLAANAAQSDGGIGGLTIFLILVVIALAIAAAFMNITAAREAARRRDVARGAIIA